MNSMSEYLKVKRLHPTWMDSSKVIPNPPESNEAERRPELPADAYTKRLSDVGITTTKEQGYEYRSKLFLEHIYGINTPEGGQFNRLTTRSTFAEKCNPPGEDVVANRHQKQSLLMTPSRYYCLQKQAMGGGGATGKGVMTCLVSSGATIKKCFNCPQCTYTTDRKNNLKRHLGTMHRDCGKTLQCCDATFASKAALREHIAWWHRAGYTCHRCVRSFSRKALLNRHLRVHDLLQRNGAGGDTPQINDQVRETFNDSMANSVGLDDEWFNRVTPVKSSIAFTKNEDRLDSKQPHQALKQHQVLSIVARDYGSIDNRGDGGFSRTETDVAKPLFYRERLPIIETSRDIFQDVPMSITSFGSHCVDWMSETGYEPQNYPTDILSMRKDKIHEQTLTETFVDESSWDKHANDHLSDSSEDSAKMDEDLWCGVVLRRAFPRRGRARMIFYNRIRTTHGSDSFSSSGNAQGPCDNDNEILSAKRTNIATVVNEICRRRPGLATQADIVRVKTATLFGESKKIIQRFDEANELWRRKRMEDIVEETKQLLALTSAKLIKCRVVRKLESNSSRLCVNSYRCDMCKVEFTSQVQLVEHKCKPSVCIIAEGEGKASTY